MSLWRLHNLGQSADFEGMGFWLSVTGLDSSPTTSFSSAVAPLLDASLPKFTWQEGQKQLPLIGCILLLIALVVSLIILCEFNAGRGAALIVMWSDVWGWGHTAGRQE